MSRWPISRIGKQYDFCAAHWLPNVPDGHQCKRMHGHNYLIEVEVRGEISPTKGFCNGQDFAAIDKIVKPILAKLDHQCLNDFIANPTAELLAEHLLTECNAVLAIFYSVTVWETPKAWAQAINTDGLYPRIHKE